MSQKIEKVKECEKEKESPDYFWGIFNLSQFGKISYPEEPTEHDFVYKIKKDGVFGNLLLRLFFMVDD